MPRFTITIEDLNDSYVSQLGGIESCYEGQELNVVEHDALLNEDGDFLVGGNVIIPIGHGSNVTSWWHIGQETRYGLKVTKLESDAMLETWGYDADYDYGYAGCTSDRKLKRFIVDQVRDRNWIAGWHTARGICNNSGQYMNTGQRLGYFNPKRSEEFKGKISLFKNHADAVRDVDGSRRVAMKVGRAFKSMFPNFCDAQIEILGDAFRAEMVSKDLTLKSGKSRADFEKAYGGALGMNENPDTGCYRKFLGNSCLRPSYLYSDDNYHKDTLPHHPAQAYASGDFTIYWVEEPDGKVAGRCVVLTTDPDKPRAGPLYGLSEQAMTTMGKAIEATRADSSWDIFRHSGWAGAKMLNIPYVNGGYVAPYLDVEPTRLTELDSDYLQIDQRGGINAGSYRGVLEGNDYCCEECGDSMHEDDQYHSECTGTSMCESCYHNTHSQCEVDDCWYHNDNMTSVNRVTRWGVNTDMVYDSNLDGYALYCTDGDWWREEDVTFCEYENMYISPNNMDEYFTSAWDTELYPLSELVTVTDTDGNDSHVSRDEAEDDDDYVQLGKTGLYHPVVKEKEGEVA